MSLINYHQQCRVCGGNNLSSILDMGEHYLHGLFVFPDFQPPTRTIPTELVRCDTEKGGCGLVQLRHSVDPDVLYSRYGYRSGTNATMRGHLQTIATNVNKLWSMHRGDQGKSLPSCLDIGCNDGFLSRQLPINCSKVGIDPCDVGLKIEGIDNFHFIHDLFPSPKLTMMGTFDIITMIACFYDTNTPVELAEELQRRLKRQGILVVEVSYWPAKMDKGAIDEVCHEHVCFYNFQNLEDIFSQVGLRIFDAQLNNINGGSIQLWMQRQEDDTSYGTPESKQNILKIKFDEMNRCLDTSVPYNAFAQKCRDLKREIRALFSEIRNRGETVHLYGASTKGNVLLQYLELDARDIPFAAERSETKWGGRTLGSNIEMVSEERSRAMKPNYYFVPIWSFKDEVILREKSYLDAGGKLIFPLPSVEIISK